MKTFFKTSALAVIAVSALLGFAGLLKGQQAPQQQIRTPRQTPFPVNPDVSKLEIQTLHVQGNVYMLAGAGANIAVQTGNDQGVLLVDTGLEKMEEKILAAIRKL